MFRFRVSHAWKGVDARDILGRSALEMAELRAKASADQLAGFRAVIELLREPM